MSRVYIFYTCQKRGNYGIIELVNNYCRYKIFPLFRKEITTLNIPYYFTPGTKAKAQEVNADFNYVLEQMGNKVSSDFSNLSEDAEKYFINKSQITNCILEAPNGVASYSGNTVTLKSGLKVLIPNGRNADGTLKNIEYTLTSNISKTIDAETSRFLFLSSDSTEPITWGSAYIISTVQPTPSKFAVWYNPDENFMYENYYNERGTFTRVPYTFIGLCSASNNSISFVSPQKPISLAKECDIDGRWVYAASDLLKNITVQSKASYTVDLSSYLPDDKCLYEVLIRATAVTVNKSGETGRITASSDIMTSDFSIPLGYAIARTNEYVPMEGTGVALVGTKRQLKFFNKGSANVNSAYLTVEAYRKVR